MVCGYFLSRDDRRAYMSFGLGGVEATHAYLGERLGVEPTSVKGWRDEFDPIHPNPRRGWWKRPLFPTRIAVVTALCALGHDELCRLVHAIIDDPDGRNADALCRSLDEGVVPEPEPAPEARDGDDAGERMRTGRAAEEHVERYVLALVRDVASAPRLSLLANPAARLRADTTVRTAVSIDRAVSDARLRIAPP